MRFTCEKSILVAGLNITGRTVAQKSALSAIEGILCRAHGNLSLPDIGKEFNRDHSTILYGIRKVEASLKNGDTQLQDKIQDITANINSCL